MGLFKKLNIKLIKAKPYDSKGKVLQKYFLQHNDKDQPGQKETDHPDE